MIQVIVNKEETSSNINTESEERHTAKRCCKCLSTSFSSSMKCLTIVFLICFMMLFHSASSQEVKHQCDPTDITTCKYGGVCKSTSTLPQLVNNRYEPSKYICVCEPVACIPILGYDPVCAEDGNTYPNDLCRRHQECLIQKPVKRSCRGTCESLECERDALSNEIACSEDFSYYCFNYGECLVHSETPEQPYCKCLPGYLGSRCESKDAREVKMLRFIFRG
ncbi:tomoregulin-2-like isoform X2 [Clavelina lepadiformis]|uniref:tomoregulin-2-like isoform X2 n=1 Tax=Clavelina lepadiformis TaxID=159417 RepID=UPI00404357D0